MRSTTLLLSFLGLVLGVGIATAAPTASSQRPPAHASGSDLPPVSAGLSSTCQICLGSTATCSTSQRATCKTQVDNLLKAHWEASDAPQLPMMRPSGTELPRDLKSGKYFKYQKSPSTFTTTVWPKGKVQALPVDRLGKVSASAAAKAHRQPAWDENKQKVATCDEYAYEELYDVMRFLDAANACRGDRDCVMDVAFMSSTPGIAERTLKRKDGKPLSTFGPFPNQLVPFTGWMPKNEMFQLGKMYLYANGKPGARPAVATVPALEAALTTGEKYYSIGLGGNDGNRSFANEWKWHEKLRERTQDVSQAEREEYERRLAKFRELTAQHSAAAAAEEAAIAGATEPEHNGFVLPYDEQTHDIFERHDRVAELRQYVGRARTRVDRAIRNGRSPAAAQPGASGQQPGGAQQHGAQQQHSARETTPAIGMLGSLGPAPRASADKPRHTRPPGSRPTASGGHSPPRLSPCLQGSNDDWGLELHGDGRISCKIGEFLREEWKRKLAGHKSCLDLGNPDCDWKPETFSTRVLEKIPNLDRYKYFVTRCSTWTSGTFSPPAANLDAAKAIIDQAEEDIGEARNILEPYYQGNNNNGRKYGKTWGADESYGVKGWFGADLDYEVGWDVAAVNKSGGNVCSLGGGLHGKVGATAYIAGLERKLLYGDVFAEVNKSASGSARFKSKLAILGAELYETGNDSSPWITSQVVEDGPFAMVQSPKASFTVPVGGVPVTGALWGELGTAYVITAKGTAPPACNAGSTAFKVTGGFTPLLFASGNGQVGVGISGIVSAGVRAAITLVQIGLPLQIGMKMKTDNEAEIVFDSTLDLTLSTLGGRVSLYIEFLMFDEEWELFRWNGIGPATVHLMPRLSAELPISGMKP